MKVYIIEAKSIGGLESEWGPLDGEMYLNATEAATRMVFIDELPPVPGLSYRVAIYERKLRAERRRARWQTLS